MTGLWSPPAITTPGRDVWSTAGGATPFYQQGVGRHAVETSSAFAEVCVTYGVMALKARVRAYLTSFSKPDLAAAINPADGLFDHATNAGLLVVQGRLGFTGKDVDGVAGPKTAKALFAPLARQYEVGHGIPLGLLRAAMDLESSWDPGAQGSSTPYDLGLLQINTAVYPTPLALAFDPTWAIHTWSVQMANAYYAMVPGNPAKPWQTQALRIDCTIGEHFAPGWAAHWWATGQIPTPAPGGISIDVYAAAVLRRRAQYT